jgi:threonine/homoserine/homoserine lactone efflux protein
LLGIFINSLIIGFSGAVMPGTVLTYTIDRSMRYGSRAGFLVSLGHALLELILVIMIYLGLGKLLASDIIRMIIGIIGGLVLLYLAFDMLRGVCLDKVRLDLSGESSKGQKNMFLAGVLLSAANPYFLIWWAAVGLSLIMKSYDSFGLSGICFFYLGHILADISWYSFVSIIISKMRHLIKQKTYRGIVTVLALFLLFFAIKFIIEGMGYI